MTHFVTLTNTSGQDVTINLEHVGSMIEYPNAKEPERSYTTITMAVSRGDNNVLHTVKQDIGTIVSRPPRQLAK
jgi:hypothetical protein